MTIPPNSMAGSGSSANFLAPLYPSPSQVRKMARRILDDLAKYGGTLRFWIGSANSPTAGSLAVQWNGQHYVYRTTKDIEDLVWDVIETAQYSKPLPSGSSQDTPWPQTVSNVTAITRAMHGVAKMAPGIKPNSWIEASETGLVIPCRNRLLDPVNHCTYEHSDKFFNLSCLPYDYDPEAQCPEWIITVKQWLQGDTESIEFLQEWLGYLVSGRTDLHAMFIGLGPKRAGKGTLLRIIMALLGSGAVGSLRMNDLVGDRSRFSLSSNIDKSLIVFPDVRQLESNEGKAFVQFALNIVGEDDIQVDIKNQTPWRGRLPARLMLMSNEMVPLPDDSGALDSRLFVLQFFQSFAGREDRQLEGRLKNELPGILNWALVGLKRLEERGEFVQPAISAHKKREIDNVSNPVRNFIDEYVYPDPDVRTPLKLAYGQWETYCSTRGERTNTERWFQRHLATAMEDKHPEANYRYDRIDGSNVKERPSYLWGVGLKGFKTEGRVVAKGRADERTLWITTEVRQSSATQRDW